MKNIAIADIMFENYCLLECGQCKSRHYIRNKIAISGFCSCGNPYENLDMVGVESWTSDDYMAVCKKEIEEKQCGDKSALLHSFLQHLSEIVEDEKILSEIIKAVLIDVIEQLD